MSLIYDLIGYTQLGATELLPLELIHIYILKSKHPDYILAYNANIAKWKKQHHRWATRWDANTTTSATTFVYPSCDHTCTVVMTNRAEWESRRCTQGHYCGAEWLWYGHIASNAPHKVSDQIQWAWCLHIKATIVWLLSCQLIQAPVQWLLNQSHKNEKKKPNNLG